MSIQSNRQMRARQLALILGAFLLVITALLGFFLLQDQRRGAKQAALLAELAQDVGRYDEQSIVLRSTTRSQADKLAELYDAELRITEDGRYATLTLPSGTTIRDALARRESRAYIDEVSADYHARISELADRTPPQPTAPQITPGDSGFAKQDYLRYLNISSSCVQTNTYGNRAVAVIDTGIDTDHPDFSGCNISSFSYNASLGKAVHEENDWSLIEDEQGHGTAVAGIISASWDNGGKAFLDDSQPGMAYGRIYKITRKQFEEVQHKEGRDYTKLLSLGTVAGLPVYSFTDTQKNSPERMPSEKYFSTILSGLKACYEGIVSENALAKYLIRSVMPENMFSAVRTIKENPHSLSNADISSRTGCALSDVTLATKWLVDHEVIQQDRRSIRAGHQADNPEAYFFTMEGPCARGLVGAMIAAIG